MNQDFNIIGLVGKTLSKVELESGPLVVFTTTEGERYCMYHAQDCCESVGINNTLGGKAAGPHRFAAS
jgi:hypothetical protein